MLRSPLHPLAKFLSLLLLGLGLSLWHGGISAEWGLPSQAQEVAPAPANNPLDLFWQGYDAFQNNRLKEAIALWQQSLALYREAGNREGEQSVLSALGAAYLQVGDHDAAIAHLEAFRDRVLGSSDSASLPDAERLALAQGLSNLGIAYAETGHYASAIDTQEAALGLMQSFGEAQAPATGQVWGNLGNAYAAVGDYEAAIAAHQERRAIAQAHSNALAEAEALSNLGVLQANQGDYAAAIDYYLQSLLILEQSPAPEGAHHHSQAHLMLNLASAYHAQGDLEQAQGFYTQSLTLARAVGDRTLEAKSLGGLGMLHGDQGDLDAAIALQRESLTLAQSLNDPQLEAQMLNNLGHSLFDQEEYREAERLLQRAIARLESLRPGLADLDTISLLDSQVFSYSLLQQILVAQGQYGAALEVSERGRARAFVELLARRTTPGDAPDEPPSPPTADEIRAIARQQNATLVEYAIVADDDFKFQGRQRGREAALFIWVVSPTGDITFRNVDLRPLWNENRRDNSLANLVSSSRLSIGVRSDATHPNDTSTSFNWRKLQQLHEYLIAPIADQLPTDPADPVIIIPQDALFLVPFAALQDADGHYLLEQHTLLTAPSIQVIGLNPSVPSNRPPAATSSILLVGNPTMPAIAYRAGDTPSPLTPLPGAEQEVRTIGRLLNAPILLGDEATEPRVRSHMPTAQIIHLATHGLLDYGQTGEGRGQDIPGAIALAPQPPITPATDGLLTTAEILNLRLSADLVVLSACNTGRGEITGDGVVGLSRSFLSAGAKSIIVSLWAVSDESTAYVMTRFYENLQHGQGKAQALRQAMLDANAEYNHPFDWAAFTLIGDAQ